MFLQLRIIINNTTVPDKDKQMMHYILGKSIDDLHCVDTDVVLVTKSLKTTFHKYHRYAV